MFKITSKKGFFITFKNGYSVSVQFGPGNYCDNYFRTVDQDEEECGAEGSTTAECSVWKDNGPLKHSLFKGNTKSDRSTPAQVLKLLNWAARQPNNRHTT